MVVTEAHGLLQGIGAGVRLDAVKCLHRHLVRFLARVAAAASAAAGRRGLAPSGALLAAACRFHKTAGEGMTSTPTRSPLRQG